MNTELQKLRSHYDSLPPPVKARTTAQSLLRAIQIAEACEDVVEAAGPLYNEIRSRFGSVEDMGRELRQVMAPIQEALARVTKQEGE